MTEPAVPVGAEALARLSEKLAAGQAALEAERYVEAATAFADAAAVMRAEWSLHQMTANAWRLAGDIVRARTQLLIAFRDARPTDVDGLYALGSGLLESGAPTEARVCFDAVVAERRRDPAALGALASAMRADGDPDGAWPLLQRALTLARKMPALLLTAAQIRHALGDTAGARHWLAKAEKIRPGHHLQQVLLAFTHLIEGARTAGWAAFEARGLPALPAGTRDWQGEPLEGQSIAVVMEQGLGDLFHFVRYVRRLELRGATRVVVECPPSAVTLLTASGFDAVPVGALPPTDWAVPLLSLPYRMGSDADTAPELVPYLRTGRPAPTRHSTAVRRIGLVSRGNPAFLSTVLRDLDQQALEMVLDVRDVQWVWLQVDSDPPAPREHRRPLERPTMAGDWLDTARLIEDLDAVVSVDTAVAHLAGAMGLETYLLLPFSPDWRWGLREQRSAWYPTVQLIRQPAPRDWPGAVAALARRLEQMPPTGDRQHLP